jgi:hypothetical protein
LPDAKTAVHWGGDARALQLYVDDERARRYSFFPMQLDLEPVLTVQGRWVVDATLGYTKKRTQTTSQGEFISRRHWVLFQTNEAWALRLGRFFPQFGWNVPDHFRFGRKLLGFEPGRETYNLEVQQRSEYFEIAITGIFKRAQDSKLTNAQGATLAAKVPVGDHQVGAQVLYLQEPEQIRRAAAVTSFVKLSERFYWMNELVVQRQSLSSKTIGSTILTPTLGYEIAKGMVPYIGAEGVWSPDQEDRVSFAGFQYFPFPHLEFKFEFQNRVALKPSSSVENWGLLMLHAYL